ncbi:CRISPR-associated protein Csx3 [Halostagnicola larsenii]
MSQPFWLECFFVHHVHRRWIQCIDPAIRASVSAISGHSH